VRTLAKVARAARLGPGFRRDDEKRYLAEIIPVIPAKAGTQFFFVANLTAFRSEKC
jgi:hypothetical protein